MTVLMDLSPFRGRLQRQHRIRPDQIGVALESYLQVFRKACADTWYPLRDSAVSTTSI